VSPRRRKAQQAPSESYAARVARGKVPVSLSLSPDALARLDAYAAKHGLTRSAAVARLVEAAS
jgi:hypothetical protein